MSMRGKQAEFLSAADPEAVYLEHLQQIVDSFDAHAAPGDDSAFRPLMLGYVGANNVGADLRVAEMLRQYATIYANFQPTIMTIGGNADAGLFSNYRLQLMDRYFPDYLEQEAGAHNAIVSCEGSMFTSTFSDVLSSIFASGLGLAARRGMPAIGFGADVGSMSDRLRDFVAQNCQGATIFCRTERSRMRLNQLGIPALGGTDPAWTFDVEPDERDALSRSAGVVQGDGTVVICPVNPYWWPITVDVQKAGALASHPELRELHYRTVFFHSWSQEAATAYEDYVNGMAEIIAGLRRRGTRAVILCMEPLDSRTAKRINDKLAETVPILISGQISVKQAASVIGSSAAVVSSRYHATLLAIAQQRQVIGVSMDNRIVDMVAEMGLSDCVVDCRAPSLGEIVLARLAGLGRAPEAVAMQQKRGLARNLRLVGEMGKELAQRTQPFAQHCRASGSEWNSFLPPLSARLERILSEHA